MTSAQLAPPPVRRSSGGVPARRAVTRWAWRLFRREWRQQLLVLALLAIAIAATTVGTGLAANAGSSQASTFGTADHLLTLSGATRNLDADVGVARKAFGAVEVIEHQKIAVPGSATPIDLRAQDPRGSYGYPTLRLVAGRYPTEPTDIAVTASVATIFNLHVGATWNVSSRTRHVVGLVENPLNLLDKFGLVAAGQAEPADHVTMLVRATSAEFDSFRAAGGISDLNVDVRASGERTAAAVVVLVLATIGLLFIGLVAVAGFTVMAQRRVRALGMLGALGATDRHVRLVLLANGVVVGALAAGIGAAAGLAGWLAFAPHLERIVQHRIDRFNVSWWAIGASLILALVTSIGAAWWPARATARIPIVAALSGRPAAPRPAHRFAAIGAVFLAAGPSLLAASHQRRPPLIVGGVVATTVGILLLAPVGIAGLAAAGGRAPIAVRLALRDLARYRARSGAALAAISLAVGIAAAITVSAAASEAAGARAAAASGGNLPADQLIVWLSAASGAGLVPEQTPAELQAAQTHVNAIAALLRGPAALALRAATDPAVPTVTIGGGNGIAGKPVATLGKPIPEPGGRTRFDSRDSVPLLVATPALLEHYGIKPSDIEPDTDLVTSRASLAGLELIPFRHPGWQPKTQRVKLPTYTSDPNTLLTTHALQALGLTALPAAWLIETPEALTAVQIDKARQLAASAGMSIETRPTQGSLSRLRTDATAAGVLLALGVLAMTVGLIRSETAGDLRTLAATGASSTTRRSLTGATAGALALLGAWLGTAGAYLALLAWHRSDLDNLARVPVVSVLVILVGLPLVAVVGGWLLAGREPSGIARQPLE